MSTLLLLFAVVVLAAGDHGRQRALGDHVAGFAGDHTPAAVAVGDMDVSGRPEPMSLPESMSTPLLLLLRSGMDELYPSPRSCRQFDVGNVLAMPVRKRATCWAVRFGHVQRVVGEPVRVGYWRSVVCS
ncbi:hypothetical protein PF005_g23409 [Phytophthora fragariae]|uniref:RxLR effector protein n=1 Tax=Phytophthora fragariae TaxID=53985 RepID=A0A6A4C2E2_9STRA|nr:hypothetical protein PF011_g26261 [Phytophthora fragariae]KAE9076340.1 hypothetical protein PF010_g23941 [Phytophthora fragariae]KAE9081594.1 hypothetical protein PF007_g22602 [Phytophthora fragariae]KAE9180141.1 hypothetical protein PF005_g23409 [Phytophthora fragariae]KAE9182729.1 hypothetical protein PF002_g26913 [Phytophthora fragariae]